MGTTDVTATQVRVSDAERERVASRLTEAHGEGRLTLAEFDERVRAAHGAVVRGDLEPLLADLPAAAVPESIRESTPESTGRRSTAALGAPWPAGPFRPGFAPPFPLPFGGPIPFGGPCSARGLRGAVATWAVVSLINVVIWVAVVVGTGTLVHPWWIWVAGPWGVALLAGAGLRRAVRGGAGALPDR